MTVTRGTTNGNDRGSVYDRRARRAWIMANWACDEPGFVRCYRCGRLLYNPDDLADPDSEAGSRPDTTSLTVDRIIPGCEGGTYRRNNIRPACGWCNSETGGRLARRIRTK